MALGLDADSVAEKLEGMYLRILRRMSRWSDASGGALHGGWPAGVAALTFFDLQFSIAGRALTVVAMAVGLAGVLAAPLADAVLLALAVSLFPGDAGVLSVMLALTVPGSKKPKPGIRWLAAFDAAFGFFVSAAGSALFSVIAVEARPLQWFVWTATMGAPLLLVGGAFLRLPKQFAPLLLRFLGLCFGCKSRYVSRSYPRHGESEPGDWFAGVWGDANMVGLWGPSSLSVCAVRGC